MTSTSNKVDHAAISEFELMEIDSKLENILIAYRNDLQAWHDRIESAHQVPVLRAWKMRISVERDLCRLRSRTAERVLSGGGLGALALSLSALLIDQSPVLALFPLLIGAILMAYGVAEARKNTLNAAICDNILQKLDLILKIGV